MAAGRRWVRRARSDIWWISFYTTPFRTGPNHALYFVIQPDDPGPAFPRLALAGVLPSHFTLAEAREHLPQHPASIGRHDWACVGDQEIPVEKEVVSHPGKSINQINAL